MAGITMSTARDGRTAGAVTLTTRRGAVQPDPEEAETALRGVLEAGESFWLDVQAPGADEVALLERVLGLHPVTVAEVKRPSQFPRLEVYPTHAVLVLHAVEVNREARIPVSRLEVDCVLGPTYLVTVHAREVNVLREVQQRLRDGAPFPARPDLVLVAILDEAVKELYAALDYLADRIAALEEKVMSGRLRNPMREVTALRRALVRLRQGLGPEEQALSDLAGLARVSLPRGPAETAGQAERTGEAGPMLVSEVAALAMRQTVDLLRRIWDGVEVERDLVDNVVEVYLGLRTDRLNLIMQRLTLITTIFMPLTLIAGIYGMNFRYMPELEWKYGYPAALLLMVVIGYGMYRWFRSQGWFGEP